MVTRKARPARQAGGNDTAASLADSAQKIWLAGLGALERAKAEGPKMFDVLVEQGRGFAARAQGAADEALRSVRDGAGEAGGRLDKLAQAMEERVARSMGRAGLAGRGEVDELSRQVRDLADGVREMMARGAPASAKPRGSRTAHGAKRKAKRAASTAKPRAKARPGAARKPGRKAQRRTR